MSKIQSIRRKSILVAAAAVSAGLVYTGAAQATDRTWNGGGTDNNWSTAFNWSPVAAPVSGDTLTFDGFGRLTNTNDISGAIVVNGITFAASAGAFTIGGQQITLGGSIVDNTTILSQSLNLPLLLSGNRSVQVVDGGSLRLGGVISDGGGGFGLTKTGLGVLTLAGANTFAGGVNISSGTVSISNDNNLGGATGTLVVNGGTLNTTANLTIGSGRSVLVGPAGGSGSSIFDVATGTTTSFGGVIANNTGSTGGLSKVKFGNLVLFGANTYTGPTSVKNGSLTLNFNAAGAPASNIINSVSSLSIGGDTSGLGQQSNASLIMTGKNAAASVQTFASTNIDLYGSVINVTKGTGTASANLNLGALTHTLGGTVVIPTGGTQGNVNTTTTVNTTNGILGAWAVAGTANVQRGITMGSDWATVDGTGNIIAYTGYVAAPIYDGTAANTIAGNAAVQGNADKNLRFIPTVASEMRVDAENANTTTDINTLAFNTAGANHVLTIGTGNTLRLGKYGGIFKQATGNNQIFIGGTGGTTFTPAVNANAGNLTAGGAPNTPGELVITLNETANNSGCITIVSNIVNNGTGAVSVIKNSVASAKLDGHNSYSGGTYINQGRLQLAGSEQLRDSTNPTLTVGNPDGLGTGPVYVAPGGYLFVSGVNGTAVYTGPGAIAGAIAGTAQNAPVLNDMFISGNGTSQEAGGSIRLGNRSILKGTITLTGDTRIFAGNGAAYNALLPGSMTAGATLYVDPGNDFTGKITGNFALDFGGRAVAGINTQISNTSNDWGGNTQILPASGTARLRLGNSEVIPHGNGKGNLLFGDGANQATLDMNGFNETVNGLATVTGATTSIVENDGFGAVVVDPTPGDPTNNDYTYSFTGATSTLTVGGFDQSASFTGIIRDFDPGASVTLPNPNYNPTGGVDPEGDLPTISVATPGGTAGAKVAFTKIGTGTQQLNGVNTYTGATNVNAGVLAVNGSLAAANVTNVASGGAIAGSGTIGSLNVASGGAVRPGTVGNGSIGTLTAAGPVNGNNFSMTVDYGGGSSDVLQANGGATFTGSNTLSPGGTPTAGTYAVINSTSAIAGAGTFTLTPFPNLPDQRPASGSLNLTNPNQIQVIVTGGAKTLDWSGATTGEWRLPSGGGANDWTDTVALTPDKFFNADITHFNNTANRNVTLNQNVQPSAVLFNNDTSNPYTISGTGSISGATGVTMSGSGSVILATNNTFNGPITINNGTLKIGGSNAASVNIIPGGALEIGAGATGGSVTGSISNEGVVRLNRADDFTFSNAVVGNGSLEKLGGNTATVSGANTYVGGTKIINGTLKVTTFNALGPAQIEVLSGGALDIGGITAANVANGFGVRNVIINGTGQGGNGALTNSSTTSQTQAYQAITLASDASVGGPGRFDVRNGAATLELASHTLTKNGTAQFSVVGGTIGQGNIIVNSGQFSIETTTVADGTGLFTYNTGGTGLFHLMTGDGMIRPLKFNGGTMSNNNQTGLSTVVAPVEFAVDTPMTVGGTPGTTPQFVLTNTLTGSGGFSKTGTGHLRITGQASYTGVTNVAAGRVSYVNNFTTGSGINVTGGKLEMETNGARTLRTGPITVSPTGALDMNDNDIIVEGQSFTDVKNLVLSGFGVPTGGITSSTSDGSQILALFDNALLGASDWNGVTMSSTAIVGKYTYFGDVNFDGQVTGDDYTIIDSNLNTTPPTGFEWLSGDANLDTIVTGDDYTTIDSNLGLGVGNPLSASALGGGLTPSALGVSAVPEPASLGLLATGAGLLLGRRRRKSIA